MQSLFSLPRRFPLYLPNDSRDERLVYRLYFPFFPSFSFSFFFFFVFSFSMTNDRTPVFFFFSISRRVRAISSAPHHKVTSRGTACPSREIRSPLLLRFRGQSILPRLSRRTSRFCHAYTIPYAPLCQPHLCFTISVVSLSGCYTRSNSSPECRFAISNS